MIGAPCRGLAQKEGTNARNLCSPYTDSVFEFLHQFGYGFEKIADEPVVRDLNDRGLLPELGTVLTVTRIFIIHLPDFSSTPD